MRCFNQLRPAMFAVSAILLIPGCMTAPGYMSPVGTLPGNGYPVGWGPTTGSVPFVPVNGPGGGYPVTGYIPPGTVPFVAVCANFESHNANETCDTRES